MSEETAQAVAEPGKKKAGRKSRKKLLAIPILLLLVAGVGYKMVLAPKPKPPVKKIAGELYALPKEFIVNLADGHYGKLSVAVVVEGGKLGKHGEVVLTQEPVLRSIVTEELTGLTTDDLIDRSSRQAVIATILEEIRSKTDEKVTEVLFTDLAVQ